MLSLIDSIRHPRNRFFEVTALLLILALPATSETESDRDDFPSWHRKRHSVGLVDEFSHLLLR